MRKNFLKYMDDCYIFETVKFNHYWKSYKINKIITIVCNKVMEFSMKIIIPRYQINQLDNNNGFNRWNDIKSSKIISTTKKIKKFKNS